MPAHGHSTFSPLDGYGSPADHARAAREAGLHGMALTDHGTTAGWYKWEKAAREEGITPLFGIESYWTPDRQIKNKDIGFGVSPAHLVLIAKDERGLRSLNAISTAAHAEGFYGHPRCDWDLLERFNEGVICTSACLGGPMGRYLLKEKDAFSARRWAYRARDIFGDDFYLELQPHEIPDQVEYNKFLHSLGDSFKYIVTSDSHYPYESDSDLHFVSFCISSGVNRHNARYGYELDLSIHSYDKLYRRTVHNSGLPDEFVERAVRNAAAIVMQNDVTLPRGLNLSPGWQNPDEDLKKRLADGFQRKVLSKGFSRSKVREYNDRLTAEYRLTVSKGFSEYFLVVQDMVLAANDLDVFVGCGRGSAGGSLVAYLLGITEIDPVKWDLAVERFMSPERGGYRMAFHKPNKIAELTEWYTERIARGETVA